jgi:hypothetical protein
MSKTLLIVESATKAKKIQSFLGSDYVVAASVGHIRDLPKREIGVQAPDFKPHYVVNEDKAQTVSRLKSLVKQAAMVYLATDLDREGEAIAWHLEQVLKPRTFKRIKFNAVTKKSILEAIQNACDIDYKLVAAQEGRRVLDRLIGYTSHSLPTRPHHYQQEGCKAQRCFWSCNKRKPSTRSNQPTTTSSRSTSRIRQVVHGRQLGCTNPFRNPSELKKPTSSRTRPPSNQSPGGYNSSLPF